MEDKEGRPIIDEDNRSLVIDLRRSVKKQMLAFKIAKVKKTVVPKPTPSPAVKELIERASRLVQKGKRDQRLEDKLAAFAEALKIIRGIHKREENAFYPLRFDFNDPEDIANRCCAIKLRYFRFKLPRLVTQLRGILRLLKKVGVEEERVERAEGRDVDEELRELGEMSEDE